MNRNIIRRNITGFSIIIFMIFYLFIQVVKPSFIYDNDGSLRQFGLGYRSKTVLPLWIISIVLAIFSYLIVLFYLTYPKLV